MMLKKYADLLVNYCLEIQPGERCFIRSTTLAEPLIKEVYQAILHAGGYPEVEMIFDGKAKHFLDQASEEILKMPPTLYREAMTKFEAFLVIRAPFNLKELQNVDNARQKIRQNALLPLQQLYSERTADRSLKRNLCQYPTNAAAQAAGMSLDEYQKFVYHACRLDEADPRAAWLEVRKEQQHIVDYLNQCKHIIYKGQDIDISFSVEGRSWINSDGKTNMPSGEVFSAPVEESVNGTIRFSYPSVFRGHDVEDVTLWVKDGYIEKWEAKSGITLLNEIFKIDGARYFGEVAIGTNYNIQKRTRNILFDEKIGGSIHMAVGQTYYQAGGKNKSLIHWDMITNMKDGGEIWADGTKIYESGQFLI